MESCSLSVNGSDAERALAQEPRVETTRQRGHDTLSREETSSHMPHDLPPPPPLPPGTTVAGRFTVEHQAGRGGVGSIFRATDSLSGQPVALKLLHADCPEALQRFAREAQVLPLCATRALSPTLRTALLIQERWPQAAVVLTTGRGKLDQHLPVGEAMDRAGQLLRQMPSLPPDLEPG